MNTFKGFIKKHFSSFAYYYSYLRYRIFIVLLFSILIGFLDGLGLTMFLPLLQMADGSAEATGEGMGKLGIVVEWLNSVGITLTLGSALLILFLFFALKGLIVFGASIYKVKVNQYFAASLRIKMTQLFTRFSYRHFVKSDVGRIQNSFTGETFKVTSSYRYYSDCIQQAIMVTIYLGFVFMVDWKFAILVCIGGGISNLFFNNLFKETKKQSIELSKNNSLFQRLVIQLVDNFKYLKATGFLRDYGNQLIQGIKRVEANNTKIGYLNARIGALREPFMVGIVCLVILFQVMYLDGNLGGILLSLLFFYRALGALMQFQNRYNAFLAVSGSLENIKEYEEELKQGAEKEGKHKITQLQQQIEIKNIGFGYEEDTYILKNLSLDIPKNQAVAFVGESGSGKTTLVNLISGLLKPNQGDILVDGISFTKLNFSSYQSRIGYIAQEAVIFNDSVFNNITLWAEPTPENIARYEEALHKAAIYDFVDSLELKEKTLLGHNGINISGGQRQRISIARELYKDIDILILDEATSALDSETEREIQDNIDQLKGSYTIIIIAHRLSTIRNADRVYLMEKGEIIVEGTFESLIETSDRFRKMVELQELN